MRPYLAIVKDSFREAFHSRVLWVVLLIITLFLLLSSLLSYRQTLTVGVQEDDIRWPKLVAELQKTKAGKGNRGAQHIWSLLSSPAKAVIENYKPLPKIPKFDDPAKHAEQVRPLLSDLQGILNRQDLYDSVHFATASLRMEGKELVRRDKTLSKEEKLRLNRLLLEGAFGEAIKDSESTSLVLCIAWKDLTDPFPMSKSMLVAAVRSALPFLVDKGLLAIGLLIAIIVTAPAIPHTFDPGSLHLLLSKPIFRSLLYLSKFLGSCAFVLLCATYLFIGLYALLGVRWAVWEPRLLWCIPIYVFVFAVYYSVASLAALLWRNVIVSILVAIVFWALCFTVGVSKQYFEYSMNRARVREIVPVPESLVVVDANNTPLAWDEQHHRWNIVLLSQELRDLRQTIILFSGLPGFPGPIYDPKDKRLLAVLPSISNGQQLLCTGAQEDDFAYREGPASPANALALLNEPDGTPLLFTSQGIYRAEGDLGVAPDEIKFLGYKLPIAGRGPLRDVGPTPAQTFDEPFAATFAPDGTLFTYSRGKLQRFTKNKDGKYALDKSEKLNGKNQRQGWIAATNEHFVLGLRDGRIQLRDLQTLEVRSTLEPAPEERPRAIVASPDGKLLAVVMEKRQLYLLAAGGKQFQLAPVSGQGDVSAIAFTADNKLLVADLVDRLTEYDTSTWQRTRRFSPPMQFQALAYHYVLNPIYTICPKPGEFYRTITYLLLEQAPPPEPNENGEMPDDEPDPSRRIRSPFEPVYSSAAFMIVMLALGCLYMERQEF